jgi:sorbitol/mannitol transport system substrate-binding protein
MSLRKSLYAATAMGLISAVGASADTLTIATVNNGDMIRMQGYTSQFTEQTGINVEWVTLEENVLRQRVTTDITTNGGQFDIMTIGMYETPIWGANGWLVPLDGLSEAYDVDDILPAMRDGLSHEGTLFAAPFYGESSMVMYRTDLMAAAGLEMPSAPTWDDIRAAAAAMNDRQTMFTASACVANPVGARAGPSSP